MRFCVLGSGSKGNCTYVGSGATEILIDAGFSGIEIERRLSSIGSDISRIKAILITHEHGDHLQGVGVLSRKHGLPVYANEQTRAAADKVIGNLHSFKPFATGRPFILEGLTIHPFAVSHDTVDPVGFTIDDGANRFGYCTDTGMISRLIHRHLSPCQGLVLECNHDPDMLKNGPYPLQLKQRIRSRTGHLANGQALDFLRELLHEYHRHVVLAHISDSNNCHDLLARDVERFLVDNGLEATQEEVKLQISLARQGEPGLLVRLGE